MPKQKAEIEISLSNGQQAGKTINELTAQSAKLAREIKKMEIGSTEYVKATEDYQKVSSRLKDVKTEVFSTQKAQSFLNSTFGDMIPFQGEFAKLGKGIGGVGSALRGASGAANLLKVALASAGIGLVIIALSTLWTWLNKTQKGMDFVGKVTAAASATFQVIIDRVLTFAGAMASLFSGDWDGAIEGITNTFKGLGKEIVSETKEAYKLEGAIQDITRAEKQLELQRSKSRAEIERLKMVAEDQSKSEKERLEAAQRAHKIEQDLLNQSIQLKEKELDVINSKNRQGTSVDDDINKAIDVEIELNNLRQESFTKQTELQNKINALKKKGSEEVIESSKKEFLVVSENIEKEVELLGEKIAKEYANKQKAKEELRKLKEEALEENLEILDRENELVQNKLLERFYTNQITEEELREQSFEKEKEFLEKRLATLALYGETEVGEYQKIYTELAALNYDHNQEKIRNEEEYNKAKIQLENESYAAASDLFGSVIGLLERDEAAKRKNFAVIKAMRLADLTTSSISEIQAIWEMAAKNPLNAIFPGAAQVIAGVKTAAALLRFGTGVSKITQTNFAEGGPVFGPSHSQGGIPFSVNGRSGYEMEGGEIILSKGVYQDPVLRSLASEINYRGGGRKFEMGGPVSSSRVMSNVRPLEGPSSSSAIVDLRRTESYLKTIAEASVATANKPVLSTKEINSELVKLNEVVNDARF